eukprot:TRINITY_DN2332_c1_g1_i1.p1 TRINITY_DN2332_c1_g1~~TRINITY_DN2332_c1_g1_i1.p1  ORF type:complete len:272 (+),score=53.30 TRINITY_DN2332_c1_g1_i1:74-817(+)
MMQLNATNVPPPPPSSSLSVGSSPHQQVPPYMPQPGSYTEQDPNNTAHALLVSMANQQQLIQLQLNHFVMMQEQHNKRVLDQLSDLTQKIEKLSVKGTDNPISEQSLPVPNGREKEEHILHIKEEVTRLREELPPVQPVETVRKLDFSDTTLASGLDISGLSGNSLGSAGDNPVAFTHQQQQQQHHRATAHHNPRVFSHKNYPVTASLNLGDIGPIPRGSAHDVQDSDGFSPDTREFLNKMKLLEPI